MFSSTRIRQLAPVVLIVVLFGSLSVAGEGSFPFQRADTNRDGRRDLSDGVGILLYLFVGTIELGCLDAADTNDDGSVALNDAIGIFQYLFRGGDEPAAPHGVCGQDTTPDDLDCAEYDPESCPNNAVPESNLPEVMDFLYPGETEECCLDVVGVYTVAAGVCESLGGTVVLPGDPTCETAPTTENGPGFDWYFPPPEGAIGPVFPVEVILEPGSDAEYVTFDLIQKRPGREDFGPMRLDTVEIGPSGGGAGFGIIVEASPTVVSTHLDLSGYARGLYEIVAIAWKGAAEPPTDVRVFEAHVGGAEEEVVAGIAEVHPEIVAVSPPAPVQLDPAGPQTLSTEEILEIASFAPANDPEMDARLANLEAASQQLKSVYNALNTPEIADLKQTIAEKTAQLNDHIRHIKQCDRVESGLATEVGNLSDKNQLKQIVERFLSTYFGDEWCEKVKQLIERRGAVLAGVAKRSEQQLDNDLADAKQKLKDKCDELDTEKDKLDDLNDDLDDLDDLESKVRDAYAAMLAAAGQYVAQLYFKGPVVHSRVIAVHVTPSGEGIAHSPTSRAYRDAEEALEGLKEDYADKWKEVDDQKKKVEGLEAEKKELEDLVAKLQAGATEVDQIDDALAKYFDAVDDTPSNHLPYMADVLDELDRLCPRLSNQVRNLFATVPTTLSELQRFKQQMAALRTRNNQDMVGISNDLDDKEQKLTTKQKELETMRADAKKCADDLRALQEQLAHAQAAAAQAAWEIYQNELDEMIAYVQGWKDDDAFKAFIEELKKKILENDPTAMQQLLAITGLEALDQIAPGMGKGLGAALTLVNLPACFCKFLRALADLVLPSNQPTATYVAATIVIKTFEECSGAQTITTVALTGAQKLADKVNKLSKEQKSIMHRAITKAIKDFGCP